LTSNAPHTYTWTVVTPGRLLQFQSAKEAVTEEIRALIHRGDIGPGERISIEDLATAFGVSRTPVRDALFQLSAEGLVTIEPRVGVFVRHIGVQEALDVYRIKSVLEPLMVEQAAERGTIDQRRTWYKSVDELDLAAKDQDVQRYVSRLEARRAAVLEMTQSLPLQTALSILDGRVRLLRFRNLSQPGQLARSASQHRAIAKAVRDGDPSAAAAAMRFHMEDALSRIRSLLASEQAESLEEMSQASSKESTR
jgi:DNA-binding GntR family transcriptional regulator